MRTLILSTALFSLVAAAPLAAAPVEFTFDPGHTQVRFGWNHFGYSNLTARFDTVEGSVVYDAENPSASSVKAKVTVDSLDSGVEKLDAHLKTDEFFDVAKFPTAEFTSTKVEAAGEGKLRVTGDLTIHGVTKSVSFDVTVNKVAAHPMSNTLTAGFDARATIKRSEFGVARYAPNVSDEITLEITAEAPQAK